MKNISSIILVLMTIGILANIYLSLSITNRLDRMALTQSSQSSLEELPEYFSTERIDELYNEFETEYNSNDKSRFFEYFSAWARAQMKRDEINSTYSSLREVFGDVSDGTYSHVNKVATQGNWDFYEIHFIAKASNQGKPINLKLSLRWDGKVSEIYGANLNMN